MKYLDLVVNILAGLAVCIPLVIKLVQVISKATKEKNWSSVMVMAMNYMEQAESMTANGAGKKAWVMNMIEQSAKNINYDLTDENREKISAMIDSMCTMAKTVNTEVEAK